MISIKKISKKIWTEIILAVILCLIWTFPVFAGTGEHLVAKFIVGQNYYTVNNARQEMDVAPYIKGGRTFLPVRYAAYAVGVTDSGITWDAKTDTVTITKGSDTIDLVVGRTTMTKNGKDIAMDAAPEITAGRTMLPIRFVGEALGAKVDWDQTTKTVTLTLGDQPAPLSPTGQIDMAAAMSGTLQPPAAAVATPDDWGFAPTAKEIAFTVGDKTATYTGLDGTTRPFDLGTAPMVIGNKENVGTNWLITNFPNVYKLGVTLKYDSSISAGALYAPFIPIAEAFGVPAQNIVWDGTHLAIFGYFQHAANYVVLTVGSRDMICKVEGNTPAVGTGHSSFPLCVLNGQPALGLTSVSDFDGLLFAAPGTPNLINASQNGRRWDYETGTAAVGCSP